MKTTSLLAFVFAASFATTEGVVAQTTAPTLTSSPAPAVSVGMLASQTIYSPRLPSAQELTDAARAQHIAIDKIDQTASQVSVTYRYGDGQTKLVSYQLLPAAPATAPVSGASPTTPPPVVVYNNPPPPRVVYYYDDPYPRSYYYPGYIYPPVSLSLGFGFGHYSRGGFYGGGFRHGWR